MRFVASSLLEAESLLGLLESAGLKSDIRRPSPGSGRLSPRSHLRFNVLDFDSKGLFQ